LAPSTEVFSSALNAPATIHAVAPTPLLIKPVMPAAIARNAVQRLACRNDGKTNRSARVGASAVTVAASANVLFRIDGAIWRAAGGARHVTAEDAYSWRPVRESNPCRRREREGTYCNSRKLSGMDRTLPHLKDSRECLLDP